MKNLIFIFISFVLIITSCKKEKTTEDTSLHGTRLKTYSFSFYERVPANTDKYIISYNSFNKIDKVEMEDNGVLYQTAYLIYKSDKSLDSIIYRNPDGSFIGSTNIECDNFRVIQYNNITLSYKSNGLLDKKSYGDGSYFRSEFNGDSVMFYYKANTASPEILDSKYKLSNIIKNPFLIPGFEKEAPITSVLLYYNNIFFASLATIEEQVIANYDSRNYTFQGDFNGYPLLRINSSSINPLNRSKEIFTYEEF